MSTDGAPAPRPRRGPIARIYRVVYWLFVVGVLLSISLSVTWHVLGGSADAEVSRGDLDVATCRTRITQQYQAMRSEAQTILFAGAVPSIELETRWRTFSVDWRNDVKGLRVRCPLKTDADLRQLTADVERMHMAWSTALGALVEVGRRPLQRLPDALGTPSHFEF